VAPDEPWLLPMGLVPPRPFQGASNEDGAPPPVSGRKRERPAASARPRQMAVAGKGPSLSCPSVDCVEWTAAAARWRATAAARWSSAAGGGGVPLPTVLTAAVGMAMAAACRPAADGTLAFDDEGGGTRPAPFAAKHRDGQGFL